MQRAFNFVTNLEYHATKYGTSRKNLLHTSWAKFFIKSFRFNTAGVKKTNVFHFRTLSSGRQGLRIVEDAITVAYTSDVLQVAFTCHTTLSNYVQECVLYFPGTSRTVSYCSSRELFQGKFVHCSFTRHSLCNIHGLFCKGRSKHALPSHLKNELIWTIKGKVNAKSFLCTP